MFGWALSWEGLHPPLSGAIHGSMQALGFGFGVQWTATVLAGLAAAVTLGLDGWRRSGSCAPFLIIVGLVSVAPLQANYGLNTSPYPWAVLLTALSTSALLSALEADTPAAWRRSAWVSALAAQVHVLVAAAVMAQVLLVMLHGPRWWKERAPQLKRWGAVVGISLLLLIGMSLYKTLDAWTFHVGEDQAGMDPWWVTSGHMLRSRFVPVGPARALAALLVAGGIAGLFSDQRRAIGLLVLQALAYLAALVLFFETGTADPRLTHYYLVPQLLLVAAGAWGLAAVARRVGRPGAVAAVALVVGAGWSWGTAAQTWYVDRATVAQDRVADSAAVELAPYWSEARRGDVVLYLWDHTFLNDEPEHMDPIGATWPTSRLGRPCFSDPDPRLRCNQHRGAYFYFSPNLFSRDDFDHFEETFRLILNRAEPPGRAVVIAVPNRGETAEPPWPWESWLDEHGAVRSGPLAGGAVTWELPAGTVFPEPPPLNPGE